MSPRRLARVAKQAEKERSAGVLFKTKSPRSNKRFVTSPVKLSLESTQPPLAAKAGSAAWVRNGTLSVSDSLRLQPVTMKYFVPERCLMLEGRTLRSEVEGLSDFIPTASEAQHFLLATLVEEFSNLVLHELGSHEIAHLKQLHGAIGKCLGAYEATFAPRNDPTQSQKPETAIQASSETFGLVVEDEGLIAFDLKSTLTNYGINVALAPSLAKAWTIVTRRLPEIAVLDIRVLDGETFDLARYLLKKKISVIFVTAYASLPDDLKATPCLLKPLNAEELKVSLERALANRTRILKS